MREVSRSDGGRERLPLSHAVRVTAPLTRGAFKVRRRKGERYMKATGIVRRVEKCGRIVIPKEIRRTLKIREGAPLLQQSTNFTWRYIVCYKEYQRSEIHSAVVSKFCNVGFNIRNNILLQWR